MNWRLRESAHVNPRTSESFDVMHPDEHTVVLLGHIEKSTWIGWKSFDWEGRPLPDPIMTQDEAAQRVADNYERRRSG